MPNNFGLFGLFKGSQLVNELIDAYGLQVVQAYMNHIQRNAEVAVQDMLKSIGKRIKQRTSKTSAHAVDYLDDGSVIKLHVDFDVESGKAVFDFRYVLKVLKIRKIIQLQNSSRYPSRYNSSLVIGCTKCFHA